MTNSVTDGTKGIPMYIMRFDSNKEGKSGGGPISQLCILSIPVDGGTAP